MIRGKLSGGARAAGSPRHVALRTGGGLRLRTLNELEVPVGVLDAFELARQVERWPAWLSHYRWVRLLRRARDGEPALVDMAAGRPFGPVHWPVWWRSEMRLHPDRPAIAFRHVAGVTRGMDVRWTFDPAAPGRTRIRVEHRWNAGPGWPLIGRFAADRVIGPHFVHAIADLTLSGLARQMSAGPRRMGADARRWPATSTPPG